MGKYDSHTGKMDFASDKIKTEIFDKKSCLWNRKSYSTFCQLIKFPRAVMFFTPEVHLNIP